MIDLNALSVRLAKYRKRNNLPRGKFDYIFMRTVCEVVEAYDAHRKGFSKEELGKELADILIFVLDISEQKGINLEDSLLEKISEIEKRKYKKMNGYITKTNKGRK